MNKNANYLKLTVTGSASLHDSEAASCKPVKDGAGCTVSWVFTFTGKAEAAAALEAAKAKRAALRKAHGLDADAVQLSTWRPSTLRGVPVIGVSRPSLAELAVAS